MRENVLTHSLTSRPSSMRVGDSRRPLRYLSSPLIIIIIQRLIRRCNMSIKSRRHCARSCDISFSWMYSQPVHSSMSCIHCLLGLPWCRSPSVIPSRTVSANCPALSRVIWPKYCSFSFATLPINSLFRPNFVNIESFVRCSCHEMLSIFLQHHIWKVSILFLSDFFKVHPSTPYWNTAHTIDFMTLTFVAVFIFRSFQILASTTAFCLAIVCWHISATLLSVDSLLIPLMELLIVKTATSSHNSSSKSQVGLFKTDIICPWYYKLSPSGCSTADHCKHTLFEKAVLNWPGLIYLKGRCKLTGVNLSQDSLQWINNRSRTSLGSYDN